MDRKQTSEVWTRLQTGASLDGFGIVDGRVDLRRLRVPESKLAGVGTFAGVAFERRIGLTEVRGVHWRGLDFSNADLRGLLFFDSRIENCRFDGADCRGLKFFGAHVAHTTFRGARFDGAVLTTASQGLWNRFEDVTFGGADLRGAIFAAGLMVRCSFEHARLDHVEFHGTVLEDCVFAGHLNCVCFYRNDFGGKDLPPNEMKNADLRRTTFNAVGFRKLDLETVLWPEAPDHVVLDDYPAALDRMISYLERRDVWTERYALGGLCDSRKWLGENQKRGVLCESDVTFLLSRRKTFEALLEVARDTMRDR